MPRTLLMVGSAGAVGVLLGALLTTFLLLTLMPKSRALSPLPPIGPVTRIEIYDSDQRLIRTITDDATISAVVDFVDARRSGWEKPGIAMPIASINARFYNGGAFQGRFGVAGEIFVTQHGGGSAMQAAPAADVQTFLRLIGVQSTG